ncbi:MAG: DUF6675 family protein [Gammaproteobacteria bacterium]
MISKHEAVWPRLASIDIRASRFVRSLIAAFAFMIVGSQSQAEPPPICPSHGAEPYPSYGDLGKPPNTATWRDVSLALGADCKGLFQEPMALVVALAGRFEHNGSAEDIAERMGAISLTQGLIYWSTTEQGWRELVTEAYALEEPDVDKRRSDFTADEILSGRTLHFAQDDTRSTGSNIYSITARSVDRDHLSFEIINLTPIRLWFLTLFEPRALRSIHFIERQDHGVWGYYGISMVTNGVVDEHENSFINRNVAVYRFLIGQPADQAPPVAP